MQKRILNYRPTWDLVSTNYADSLENVTANYYPINSAISMQDGNRVFTVMNGRSQGGSALAPGNIELMQNRRIPADDARGMGEYVDEKDSLGNGIRVPATYYVQIFDKTKTANNQRVVQKQKFFEAAQYFYNFNLVVNGTDGRANNISTIVQGSGIGEGVDYVIIPLEVGKILMRLENFAEETRQIDMYGVCAGIDPLSLGWSFKELSLSGNMPIEEMDSRKIQWKTVDDHKLQEPVRDTDWTKH